jgi:hypothetical protein
MTQRELRQLHTLLWKFKVESGDPEKALYTEGSAVHETTKEMIEIVGWSIIDEA